MDYRVLGGNTDTELFVKLFTCIVDFIRVIPSKMFEITFRVKPITAQFALE